MGISNLKVALARKFSSWSGERIFLEGEIAKINQAMATLDDKRDRVARLTELTRCTREIMAELDPKWKPDEVKPSRPLQKKLPYDAGMVTRWAMELIREAEGPFSSQQLAEKIVMSNEGNLDNTELIHRVREAVDASLRKKLGIYVRYTQTRPTLWVRINAGDADAV